MDEFSLTPNYDALVLSGRPLSLLIKTGWARVVGEDYIQRYGAKTGFGRYARYDPLSQEAINESVTWAWPERIPDGRLVQFKNDPNYRPDSGSFWGGLMEFLSSPGLRVLAAPLVVNSAVTALSTAASAASAPAVTAAASAVDGAALASAWEGGAAIVATQNAALAEVTGTLAAGTVAKTIGEQAAATVLKDAVSIATLPPLDPIYSDDFIPKKPPAADVVKTASASTEVLSDAAIKSAAAAVTAAVSSALSSALSPVSATKSASGAAAAPASSDNALVLVGAAIVGALLFVAAR